MISFEEWIALFGAEPRFAYCRKGEVPPADRIVIWEDQWQHRQNIVRSRVLSKLGLLERIPGRLCTLQRISRPLADKFLEKHHLQGTTASKIKYGLFLPEKYYRVLKEVPSDAYPGQPASKEGQGRTGSSSGAGLLMAVMTFSGPRQFHDGTRSYEMIRFAVRCNFHVQGGFSRLLQHFIREKDPDSIMTYVDLDWYTGATYEALGFEPAGVLRPIGYTVDEDGRRRPVSGAPASGDPVLEEPIAGAPTLGTPVAGTPVAGTPVAGILIPEEPGSGEPAPEESLQPPHDVINKGSLKMIWKKKLQ